MRCDCFAKKNRTSMVLASMDLDRLCGSNWALPCMAYSYRCIYIPLMIHSI